jgi:5-oxopent-3-ene-1,2,5-tricarboxylate decarboxylase/2-hydroxyhepta-2,4-diene-1,7-dioate isomerase
MQLDYQSINDLTEQLAMLPASWSVPMDVPPYRLSGRLYGALLNHRSALAELGSAVDGPPYLAPPRAPVLYIKPSSALASDRAEVTVPHGVAELQVGANLGLVIGRTACNLSEDTALEYVAGYLIVNDVSVPHGNHYRPSIRQRARDGFCPVGPRVVPRDAVPDPDALAIRVRVDGDLRQSCSTADLQRPVRRLLAEVTEFMTLAPGDVLAVGSAAPLPRVCPGQRVAVEIDHIGVLENPFVAEQP